ncbi:hypothetical protein Tco_0553289 [Tanacetum coccineum]
MLVDALLQHKVEGRVDRLVEEVEELESKWAELVDELVIKVTEEVAKQSQCLLPTIVAQVGDHISNQGISGSRNDNATNESIQEDDRNVNIGNGRNVYSYKEFVACKPTEFDGKGGAVAYIRWVEKIETVQDISGCIDERRVLSKQRNAEIRSRVLESLYAGVLIDEAVRNGSLKRTGERRGDGVRREYTGSTPKCTNCNFHHHPETPCRACNRLGHFAKNYRARPKMVNLLNARNPTAARGECYECGGTDHYKAACLRLNRAPGQGGNRQNQTLAIEGGQGRRNNGNPARGRAFMMGAEEAR